MGREGNAGPLSRAPRPGYNALPGIIDRVALALLGGPPKGHCQASSGIAVHGRKKPRAGNGVSSGARGRGEDAATASAATGGSFGRPIPLV